MRLSKKIREAKNISNDDWFKIPIHLRNALIKKVIKSHIKKVNSKIKRR